MDKTPHSSLSTPVRILPYSKVFPCYKKCCRWQLTFWWINWVLSLNLENWCFIHEAEEVSGHHFCCLPNYQNNNTEAHPSVGITWLTLIVANDRTQQARRHTGYKTQCSHGLQSKSPEATSLVLHIVMSSFRVTFAHPHCRSWHESYCYSFQTIGEEGWLPVQQQE